MFLIIACILGGFLVNKEYIMKKLEGQVAVAKTLGVIYSFLDSIKSYIGLACIVIGVWSFFSPGYSLQRNTFLGRQDFIGDLFPAIFAFVVGIILSVGILKYVNFSKDEEKSTGRRDRIQKELENQTVLIGFLSIAFGFLHMFDYTAGGLPLI